MKKGRLASCGELNVERKKKLLFAIGMFAGGGAEKVLVNMVNEMDLSKYDITIYSVFDTGLRPELKDGIKLKYSLRVKRGSNDTVKGDSLKAKFLNWIFLTFWRYFPMKLFYRMFIRGKYDYEIAYAEGIPHKIIAASPNKHSIKYAWIHIDLSVHERALEMFRSSKEELNTYKKFKKIIFVSDYAKEKFISKYGNSFDCVTKYNVNQNDLILNRSLEINTFACSKHPLLITVGRLHEQKGYDRLLEAALNLKKAGLEFEIWIIGEGALRSEFDEYINSNDLNDYVKLLGYQENPYSYLVKADWFIAPSRYEGYSTVVSEAIILGIPVMVTGCSGMNEITDNGKYGIVVENSLEGIKCGIERIITMGKDEYKEYKRLTSIRRNYFDPENKVKSICELFDI